MRAVDAISVGLCEDDAELRSVLAQALGAEGCRVLATATGHNAVRRFSESPPDVLVLDIGLPDADGRDVCQALRAHGVDAPILFLTAHGGVTDRLSGFSAGGDDYLTKPFAIAELVFRVRALLRRAPAAAGSPPDGLRLDPATHAVHAGDRSAPLTPTEFRLLGTLLARPKEVVRRREPLSAASPDGAVVYDNPLDPCVARLRRKLRELGTENEIATARGVGCSFR